ncbi:MAG: hypothetical protein JW804_05930 [Sedimentisphaerales bacterium]|nr:hypothetical protein [Sedimentisphaerales bacterium]
MKYREIIWLLPLLAFYLVVCIVIADNSLDYDQSRYAMYSENLTKGFYIPADTLYLWNGPGYPIVLMPFAAAKIPYIYAKYLNPFFLFAGVIFFYLLLREYTIRNKAMFGAYLLGLYPPFLPELPMLLTESLCVMLVSGFAFFVVKFYKRGKLRFFITAGIFGAYLILTKVMFAYVIALTMLLSFAFCLWKLQYLKTALICLLSLLFCTPYLAYTYSLTGRFFCWANSGGYVLYWMSNPHPEEWGDYRPWTMIGKDERVSHHVPLYEKLKELNYVEQDDLLKQQALKNIREHPLKYLSNLVSNFGRMWFDYPFSYKYQRPQTLLYMFSNSFLFVCLVLCSYPLFRKTKELPVEIISISYFGIIFIGLSLFVYTNCRYLVPIVPILTVLIFYTFFEVLDVKFKNHTD